MMGIGYFLFSFADLCSFWLGSVFLDCASLCVFACLFCAKGWYMYVSTSFEMCGVESMFIYLFWYIDLMRVHR